jgi:hypothetical protein
VLLTRDVALLKRKEITHGYYVRTSFLMAPHHRGHRCKPGPDAQCLRARGGRYLDQKGFRSLHLARWTSRFKTSTCPGTSSIVCRISFHQRYSKRGRVISDASWRSDGMTEQVCALQPDLTI